MRIQRTERICGYAARDIRALMRAWGEGFSDGDILIRDTLKVSAHEVKGLVKALCAEGYLERAESTFIPGGAVHFQRTVKGAALAMASAASPVRRALAQQRLHELIARMEKANEDPSFLVGVEESVVFGSYLTPAERLGDLDISYTTFRKIDDGGAFIEASRRAATESGRQFRNYVEFLCWPDRQLRLFLQNRSRVYSLAHDEALLKDVTIPRRIIFKDRRPVPDWRDI
jgi:hypothetical protein